MHVRKKTGASETGGLNVSIVVGLFGYKSIKYFLVGYLDKTLIFVCVCICFLAQVAH